MDFVANGSKNVEIETSTGVYLRHAIQTHFVEIGEDYIELVNRYVKPLYEEGDLLSISEKIIALCQKRVVYRKDMKISWLAKFLSRFAIQHNSAGIGVGEVCKMQFAIDECGAWKVLWAAICAGFGKLVGKHGIFYDMVGMEVTGLDGFYPDVFPVYGDYGIRIPENPSGVCNEIYEKTGVRSCVRSSAITPRVRMTSARRLFSSGKSSNFPLRGKRVVSLLAGERAKGAILSRERMAPLFRAAPKALPSPAPLRSAGTKAALPRCIPLAPVREHGTMYYFFLG